MIVQIRDFIRTLAVTNDFSKINVNFLGDNPTEYVIEPIPAEKVVKTYVDGSRLCQFVFQFGSREYYSSDVIENMQNTDFYDDFTKTIEFCNRKGILPNIEGIQSIECLNLVSLQDVGTNTAKYAIQMRITYFTKYVASGGSSV